MENVEEVAEKVKAYAEKHTQVLTEGDKKYAPSLAWQYAARLMGWVIRITDVSKQGGYVVATAEAIEKAQVVASGKGCATAEEGAGASRMMKLAQERATNSVLTGLGYVMKAAGFEQVIMEDHIAAPPAVPAPEKPVEAVQAPVKKTLEQFKADVEEFDDKLALMVEKLSIVAAARKEGLSNGEIMDLEETIRQKYNSLKTQPATEG